MQDDRLVGARPRRPAHAAAAAPTPKARRVDVNAIQDPVVYGRVPNVAELGLRDFQLGQKASPLAVGLRDHSMRTPGQLQQNFPREVAFSEAAARAGSTRSSSG